ncbi:MAG: hypothetical protein KJ623_04190 [Nanoarchaeota archaeon]|nr:hypothetical protein [Nanoarchaeota archaeon]MBU0963182.1 hypothetical protein [Nanoarchaeota archaeon]
MKKLNKKEIKEITEKLKPYWKEYRKICGEFSKKSSKLEKRMNKKLNLNPKLEIFYVDGECVGIGALNYNNRKFFPLIDERELDES